MEDPDNARPALSGAEGGKRGGRSGARGARAAGRARALPSADRVPAVDGFGPAGVEAVFSLLAFAGGGTWWALFHFGLRGAAGRVLGFPAWFFYSLLLGFLLLALVLALLVREIFRKTP